MAAWKAAPGSGFPERKQKRGWKEGAESAQERMQACPTACRWGMLAICYFFLDPAFLAGAGPQGVVFRFSTFAFSVSMVSMNGSLVNAFGTPVH
jgi:hypothetical protein